MIWKTLNFGPNAPKILVKKKPPSVVTLGLGWPVASWEIFLIWKMLWNPKSLITWPRVQNPDHTTSSKHTNLRPDTLYAQSYFYLLMRIRDFFLVLTSLIAKLYINSTNSHENHQTSWNHEWLEKYLCFTLFAFFQCKL